MNTASQKFSHKFRRINLNVSREKDLAYMKELDRTDPQRFHRLQRNILKDYARSVDEIQQREKLEKAAKAA